MIIKRRGKVIVLLPLVLLLSGCIFWKLTSERTLSHLPVDSRIEDAVISGEYIFLACRYDGLRIIDISDPISPSQVGDNYHPPMSSNVRQVDVYGNQVFLSGEELRVVDVSDPYSPLEVNVVSGWDPSDSYGWVCTVSGDYLIAAGRNWNDLLLRVYTISDILTLASPTPIGSLTIPNRCLDWNFAVLEENGYLYILFPYAFSIVDLSAMANPQLVSTTECPVSSYDKRSVAVKGDCLYLVYEPDQWSESGLGYEPGEVTLVDILDKTSPKVVETLDEVGFPAIVSGNYLLSLFGSSIRVDDISDPFRPEFVENLNVRSKGEMFFPLGDYAVIVESERGLAVVLIAPYR